MGVRIGAKGGRNGNHGGIGDYGAVVNMGEWKIAGERTKTACEVTNSTGKEKPVEKV